MKLYSYWRSSCSWRVRIALAYKGIPYEYIPVNLLDGEQFSEAYAKINPCQLVPALVDGDLVISESLAIIEYLEEKHPTPALLPNDLKKRAVVRQIASWIVSGIQPLQNSSILDLIEKKLGPEEKLQWAQYFIEKGFNALEKHLKDTAGKYCFGDDFSLADVVLLPQIGNAVRYKVDMEKFPMLKKIGETLKELPWVQKTFPQQQPDSC